VIHDEWPRTGKGLEGNHKIHRDEGKNGNSDHNDSTRHKGDLRTTFLVSWLVQVW